MFINDGVIHVFPECSSVEPIVGVQDVVRRLNDSCRDAAVLKVLLELPTAEAVEFRLAHSIPTVARESSERGHDPGTSDTTA